MKIIQCREHGGTFKIQPVRGRPPVRCGGKYPSCTRAGEQPRTATGIRSQREEETVAAARRRAVAKAPESPVEPSEPSNVSVPLALNARAQLEPLGWKCTARGYFDHFNGRDNAGIVQFEASRGSEKISILWVNGECIAQDYTLWDTDKASANGIPAGKRKLSFNPDEMTDKELIERLSGMTVVWWNRLGQGEEKATLPNRVQITHTYNGIGDEAPADRVITFVDMAGSGFRSFRVGALMRMGK